MPVEIDQSQFASQLPFFELTRVPIELEVEGESCEELLMVWCPRSGCKRWWIVQLSWRTKAYGKFKTHTCPWCFATARVPKLPPKEK